MEYLKLDFDEFFASEFGEQNYPNNPDISNNVLSLKKRIILTDELLGKFSTALAENEQLRAEKNTNLQQLQNYRQTLFSHLSSNTDWEKKYGQLEETFLNTQKQLELQINIVAARDSILRQYESLTKEKEREIRKLKDENDDLKKQKNIVEDKTLKRKYNVKLKKCKELSEIIEKLQTCAACQKLKSGNNVKKKRKNENYLDLGSFSPDNGIPASVCSMDTGFESNLSDCDSDLEAVSQKIIPKSAGMVNNDKETSFRNEKVCGAEKSVNEKLCDNSSSISFKIVDTKCDKKMNSNENSDDKRLHQHSINSENLTSTLCDNCVKKEKDVAEKYVQTRIVKYVDSSTEVDLDVVCKGTQTVEETEATSGRVLSKSTQTISVTAESEKLASTEIKVQTETNLKSNIHFPNEQALKDDVAEAQGEEELLSQIDVGCQTEEGIKRKLFKDQCVNTDDDLLSCDTDFRESLSPVPAPLSPIPPSPLFEYSENEIDDVMSDSSWSSNEESTVVDDMVDQSPAKVISFSESATQTNDVCCSCKQQRKNSHLDAATQYENFDPESNYTGLNNKANKSTVNKYAKKQKEPTLNSAMGGSVSPTKITDEADGEKFWKKLILWLMADDEKVPPEKRRIINFLQERNDFFTTEPSSNSGSEIHSHLGQIRFQRKSDDSHLGLHRWSSCDSLPKDSTSVKPIVVEMNSNPKVQESVPNSVFPFDCHQNSRNSDSEDDYDSVDDGKSIKCKRNLHKFKRIDHEKVLKSKTSMFSLCKKKYKRVTRCSLKRKLSSNKQLQISDSPSGAFTVSSLPENDRGSELNEQLMFPQPHNNSLGGFDIENDGHKSCDETHIQWTSDSPEVILNEAASNTIPLANSISSVTNSNSAKANSLKTDSTLTKQKLSNCLNLVEKGIPSTSSLTNTFSSVAKLGLCASYNVSPVEDISDSQFETTKNNYEGRQEPEHEMMISTNSCNQSFENFNEFSMSSENQPIALLQSVGQSVKGSCSEELGSCESSQSSSEVSLHSCDTLVIFQAEKIQESVKDKLNFVDDEQVVTCDGDDKCSPAKIRRLPSCNGDFSSSVDASSSVDKLADRTVYNFSDSLPKNTKSQEKLSGSQHDTHTLDQRSNDNNPLLYKTEVCLAQNKNLKEVNENLVHPVDKNYTIRRRRNSSSSNNSCSNISLGKDITFSRVNYTVEEIAVVKGKQDKIAGGEKNCTSPPSQNPSPSISRGCARSEKVNNGANNYISSDEDDDDIYHKEDENEDDGNSDHSYRSNKSTHKIEEKNTQNVENCLELSSEESSCESVSKKHFSEVATGNLQSNKISSSSSLQKSSSQKCVLYNRKTETSNSEFQEKSFKSFYKSSNIAGEITSCAKEIVNIHSNATLPYRKYCESTIKELVVVKPPPVENEIARKNMIRDTVIAKGLLIPAKAKKFVKESKAIDPSQLSNEDKDLEKQSFGSLDESSPFCRQGMTGRRKIVLSSVTTYNSEASINPENSESSSYSELTKKHQRIAHMPKKDLTFNKRFVEESSCDEIPSQKTGEHQADMPQRSCQRPPRKKTKLQKLKQQCILQRKRIRGSTSDKSGLKPTNKSEIDCTRQTKCEESVDVNVASHNPPLQDIALDMILSDSDESTNGKNQGEMQHTNIVEHSILQRKQASASRKGCSKPIPNKCATDHRGQTKCEESVDVNIPTLQDIALDMMLSDSDESTSGKYEGERQHTNILENLTSSLGKEEVNIEEGNEISNNQFQLACHSKQDNRNLPLGKKKFIKGTETSLGSIIKEQKHGNMEVVHSSSKFCQINDTLEIESTDDKGMERKDSEDEVNNGTVLESPLSPPDMNCEIDFQVPVTIPTSPVYTGASENIDVFTSITSVVVGQQEEKNEAEETLLENLSNTVKDDKKKIKLCPWSEQLNDRPKGSQEHNVFQKCFQHHSKECETIEDKASRRKKSKRYSVKKKKLELPFNTYLDEDFTEMSLTKIVNDCKKIVRGDYRIIVKNVVKHCRYSSAESCDFAVNFPMSPTMRRLFALILKLENDCPTIVNEVLERITYVVCNKKHHRSLPTLRCLARFFTAFCKMRNYKERAQIFCYDVLFCLKMQAYTVLLAVLTAFPECFPNSTSGAGNSLIVRAMVYCIFKYGNDTFLDTKNLRNFMTEFFSYKFEMVTDFENVEYFVKEIKRGGSPELEQAILLLVKFKANWSWTYEKLIKGSLLPTIESWREGLVSENSAAWCIKLCAYLAKTPPFEKPDVCDLLTLFGNYLNSETTPSVIKEACVFSVAALVHINEMKVLTILKKCETDNLLENSRCLQDALEVILKRKGMNWWTKFFFRRVETDF